MHRLSLTNSPSRSTAIKGERAERTVDDRLVVAVRRKESPEADIDKTEKVGSGVCRSQRTAVHVIPVILLLCVFVLYIFSYDPVQKELAVIKDQESSPAGELVSLSSHRSLQQAAGKGDVTATRSLRRRKFVELGPTKKEKKGKRDP